jgi:hypothetical protein
MVASLTYIQNILAAFDEAAEANRWTPGRKGCTVALTSELADDIMITGDIHGHRQNFNRIRKIADLERFPRRHLVLQEVCHGGPTYEQTDACMSHAILEDVAALKVQYPDRVHFLVGNHELAEMTDYAIQKNRQLLNLSFRLGLDHMYGDAAEEVRQSMVRFLWSCPLAVRLQGAFIAHSLPDHVDFRDFDPAIFDRELTPEGCTDQGDVFRLVWGRDYRRGNAETFCKLLGVRLLITGHEPCSGGYAAPNDFQIILDCCGEKAAYLILPAGRELSFREILGRVKKLGDG